MSDEKVISVDWVTDRFDDDIVKNTEDIKYNLLSMILSDIPELNKIFEVDDYDSHGIFDNSIIKTALGDNSHFSPGATIAAFTNKYERFVIPLDIKKYIQENVNSQVKVYEYISRLPKSEKLLSKGKELYDLLIEKKFPSQSAYLLTASFWINSGFDANTYDKDLAYNTEDFILPEFRSFANCSEGLFGLKGWSNKLKIINAFKLDTTQNSMYKTISYNNRAVNKNEEFSGRVSCVKYDYNNPSDGWGNLYQLKEDFWINIFDYYIKSLPGTIYDKTYYDTLMYSGKPKENNDNPYDDDHMIFYSSFLYNFITDDLIFNIENSFNGVKLIAETYKQIHRRVNRGNGIFTSIVVNDFVLQVLTAYLLSEYFCGTDVDMITLEDVLENGLISDINILPIDADNEIVREEEVEEYSGILSNPEEANKNYKPGSKNYDIEKACEWIEKNSYTSSHHVCAKYVRMAIEAGGLSTAGRPNWAWKYINFLPKIGFKMILTATRNSFYIPQPGDIAVYMKGGDPNVPGHICMYTKNGWRSDFKQNSMIVYKSTREAAIFRYQK